MWRKANKTSEYYIAHTPHGADKLCVKRIYGCSDTFEVQCGLPKLTAVSLRQCTLCWIAFGLLCVCVPKKKHRKTKMNMKIQLASFITVSCRHSFAYECVSECVCVSMCV